MLPRIDHGSTARDRRDTTALERHIFRAGSAHLRGRATAQPVGDPPVVIQPPVAHQSLRAPTTKSPGSEAPAHRPGAAASGAGIVEGWRGTITHRVELAADGTLARAKVVDPSFFNWPALPVALAGAIVPDFPLVNKSFNLSYAGNDL